MLMPPKAGAGTRSRATAVTPAAMIKVMVLLLTLENCITPPEDSHMRCRMEMLPVDSVSTHRRLRLYRPIIGHEVSHPEQRDASAERRSHDFRKTFDCLKYIILRERNGGRNQQPLVDAYRSDSIYKLFKIVILSEAKDPCIFLPQVTIFHRACFKNIFVG